MEEGGWVKRELVSTSVTVFIYKKIGLVCRLWQNKLFTRREGKAQTTSVSALQHPVVTLETPHVRVPETSSTLRRRGC